MAAASDDDADVFGFHYEKGMLAANLFHIRNGRIVDRREFFWEDLPETPEAQAVEILALIPQAKTPHPVLRPAIWEIPTSENFSPAAFFSALLKQLYIDQQYVPRNIYVPVDFSDLAPLTELLCEHTGHKVEIAVPQRGDNVPCSTWQVKMQTVARPAFRVLQPSILVIQEALQDALNLPALPERIDASDISHIQGAETVASMVVWEKGAMNKSEYRKFQVKTVEGVDDFASMRRSSRDATVVCRRSIDPMPSLILIDGGLGQLHASSRPGGVELYQPTVGRNRETGRRDLRIWPGG